MSVRLRNYTPTDHEDVWALHKKTVSQNDGFVKDLSFHTDFHDIPNVYEAFFVMRDNDLVIGMIGLKKTSEQSYEIKRLQVDSAHHGKGHGKTLLNQAIGYAREKGAALLHLDTAVSQAAAKNLYLSLGFSIVREEWQTYGESREKFLVIFMEKSL